VSRSYRRRVEWKPDRYDPRITPLILLRRCEEILASPSVLVTMRPIPPEAKANASSTYTVLRGKVQWVCIVVDLGRFGYMAGVLHELIHVVLSRHFERFSPAVEEAMVASLTHLLDDKFFGTKRSNKWRALIEAAVARDLPPVR
jgi:hypothetical protein